MPTRRAMRRSTGRNRTVFRAILVGSALALGAATLFAGRQGIVTTTGGQTLEGEVTEKNGQVIIRRRGIDQVLERDAVASIEYSTYAERFERALAALAKDDVDARVALGREAFDRREYDLAMKALDQAIEIDPLHREARQLQLLVSGQVQLEANKSTSRPVTTPRRPSTEPDREPAAPPQRVRGLNDEQANRVRLAELARQDRVRIQFKNNVRQRFVESQPNLNYRAFTNLADVEQVFAILEKGDPAMADDVVIMSEPGSIQFYNRRLQTAIVQGCATSKCHGGDGAGKFQLLSGPPDGSTTITNFYLLNNYVQQLEGGGTGVFDATAVPMVARGDSKNSLLYQFALPRKDAKYKHPAVKGWDGLIRGNDSRLGTELIDWMDGELLRIHMPYNVDFTLATTQPTTLPTTGPETAPATTHEETP